jgi:signal transduction histidine kinase
VPSLDIRERRVSWRRILAGGLVAMATTALVGLAVERWRFGPDDDAAVARVNAYVDRRFEEMVRSVADVSAGIAESPAAAPAVAAGRDGARSLFELVAAARRLSPRPDEIAATVYDAGLVARAWTGMPSDIPRERIAGPATLFVTPSPLGLRLVHVQPLIADGDRRVGTVATEHVLSPAPAPIAVRPADFTLATPLAPASLRTRIEGAGEQERSDTVVLRAPTGDPLAEAWVDPADLASARADWRRRITAAIVGVGGGTLLLLIGLLLDRRVRPVPAGRPAGTTLAAGDASHGAYLSATVAAVVLAAAGGLVLGSAVWIAHGGMPPAPALLLLGGATAAAVVALLVGPVARLRIAARPRRAWLGAAPGRFVVTQLLAGTAVAVLILGFSRLVELAVSPVPIDLRQFSLHPLRADRFMLLAGIVATHLAVVWSGSLLLMAAIARWRLSSRRVGPGLAVLACWLAPPVLIVLSRPGPDWPLPALGLILATTACGLAALFAPRLAAWYRHATVAARIFVLFLAFLVPTLLLYPAMDHFAERGIRQLIETEYAVQAQNHVQTLLDRMDEARGEVDRLETLPLLVRGDDEGPAPPTPDAAFLVWRQTVLARERLTSAVELYDASGVLVSRFALNVPEYTTPSLPSAPDCEWNVFGEVAPFGAEERRMLHAERSICLPGADGRLVPQGGIILHVVLEYETLPFISSQNPYLEVFRAGPELEEGTPAGSVEVTIYGWGLAPVYTSGRSAWPITDELFQQLYQSRDPFWAETQNGGGRHRVYFSNDRERIFAIGYPVSTLFDHFVHLAELATFSGVTFVLVLVGTAVFTRMARARPRVGRGLLREIRASFYRKLVLAFVLAAIIPVLALALVIRAYVETLLRADIEAEAARTAAIAQRVIEEADAPLRRTAGALGTLTDDVMVWISQVIDQDVNVFDGARLVATSERNLFASGVLPTRTPDDVYRAIVLERLPNYVRPDAIGDFSYILAAAPVRAAGEDALVTVPLALRQREIEREIDELDRGVHLAALFFVLLGAGIGLSMAERIADPIRRLTRATGSIARGDFDARIAVRSVDELRRLVDAFNSMAAELKAQRAQLERTHRLEAWAEMARQVAHEIKNPLTPIQLSAEHLRRVHADRGEPMGPVLESCVAAILGQVRLLRQISAEFSSFAASPTARLAPVDLTELLAEVVDPYRTGLAGRIAIRNEVAGALPPVLVDRTLVARALANIVENAVHAMPGAGTLTIVSAVEPAHVVLTMTDSGIGMDEEALARVFEPYFSTKTTGTGLGLPIARRNIELNGGTVDVTSAKGVGTTVIVRLPRADAEGAAEAARPHASPAMRGF